jgi:hypothetical protein
MIKRFVKWTIIVTKKRTRMNHKFTRIYNKKSVDLVKGFFSIFLENHTCLAIPNPFLKAYKEGICACQTWKSLTIVMGFILCLAILCHAQSSMDSYLILYPMQTLKNRSCWLVCFASECACLKFEKHFFNCMNKFYGNQKSNMVFVSNSDMTNQFHSSFEIPLNFTYFVSRYY